MPVLHSATRHFVVGATAGVAALLAAPYVLPIAAAVARPVVKVLFVETALAMEKAAYRLSRLGEGVQDLLAEIRLEIQRRHEKAGMASTEAVERETPPSRVREAAGAS